jgi:hypothetical protein
MGIPEYEAKRYEGRIKSGGILLSVHCDNDDWVKRAKQVLLQTGAEDIASAGEAKADFSSSDKPLPRRATRTDALFIDEDREPVRTDADVDHPIATEVPPQRRSEVSTDVPPRIRTAGQGDPLDLTPTDDEVIVYDDQGNRVVRRR